MRTFTRDQGVEQLRIKQAFADSTIAASHTMNDADAPTFGMPFHDNNAWRSHTARISTDAAYAQALQNEEDMVLISSQQCAWNLAVAEERILLDAELARSLQEAEFNNWSPTDGVALRIPENLRVQESINLASNHVISKGKARLIREGKERRGYIVSNTHGSLNHLCEPIEAQYVQVDWVDSSPGREHLTCGICMEPFQIAQTNLAAPLSAKSSSRLPYGLHLPCPGSHAYCTACLAAYIRNKLDPEGNGGESIEMVVFPIRCPECPTNEWPDGIPDEVAERVLSASEIVLWRHRKLLDSLPRYFCPNPRCSVLVQLHDDPNEPQAVCPSCSVAMCVPCGVVWHQNLTCEEYQALPLDERSPEDQKTMQLMKVISRLALAMILFECRFTLTSGQGLAPVPELLIHYRIDSGL
ncbi:hypothetical protein AcW1_001738 [Taiwanofungus camphoratus]|nr:hypothetical protein AcW1_001738 [Antrodia cinnamomea]